jgi:hypothetical protein
VVSELVSLGITINGTLDVIGSVTINGQPVLPGGIDSVLPPIVLTGTTISLPNITISTNSPSTTYNDFQGYLAGGIASSGDYNVCMGGLSGHDLTTGQNNLFLGYNAGSNTTSGNNNIILNGNPIITTGDDNIIIGNNNSTSLTSLTNVRVLGNNNVVNYSSCNVIGDAITPTISNSSYMGNIRNVTTNSDILSYNTTTNEITYGSILATSPITFTSNTIAIPVANASTNGYLSGTDWNTFNNKLSTIVGTSPITCIGNNVAIPVANASTNGYLSSTDWNTFSAGPSGLLTSNNTWTGTNIFNNDTTINGNGSGTSSPKLYLTLDDFYTTINDPDNLFHIVQTTDNKCYYLEQSNLSTYSNHAIDINNTDYVFDTIQKIKRLNNGFIYTSTTFTQNRNLTFPCGATFKTGTGYGDYYSLNFTLFGGNTYPYYYVIDTEIPVYGLVFVKVNGVQVSTPYNLTSGKYYHCSVEKYNNSINGSVIIYHITDG